MFVFLAVLFTQRKRINLIKFLQLMVAHNSTRVVFFGAIVTKLDIFVDAVHLCPLVLAIHALEIILSELLLSPQRKSDLVLHPIVVDILQQEVVLERILLNLALDQHRVRQNIVLCSSIDPPQIYLAEQEAEFFVGFGKRMDVDVAAAEHHLSRWHTSTHYSLDVVSV